MIYDITKPDITYEWLCSIFEISDKKLFCDYIVKCNSDFDMFIKKHSNKIKHLDLNELEIVAFHVTTNGDKCDDINKNGIRNLQAVLQEENGLSKFLYNKGIRFDIPSKIMYVNDKAYSIDYTKYTELNVLVKHKEVLREIGRKIFSDFRVNGFLFNNDIYNYSTIHEAPEFLDTLSKLGKETSGILQEWESITRPYVVKYKAKIDEFDYSTFDYDNQYEYKQDCCNNCIKLKKVLLKKAIESAFNESNEIIAYMKPEKVVAPENIILCKPAEKW